MRSLIAFIRRQYSFDADIRGMLQQILTNQEATLAAIDTLKTDIAALISEAVSDITAAVTAAQAASNDPAIDTLDKQVTAATATLKSDFAALSGTPVPPTTP